MNEGEVAEFLRTYHYRYLPKEIFEAIAEGVVRLPICELVPLKIEGEQSMVLMQKRPNNDPYWAGQYHIPGTVVMTTDEGDDLTAPITRILDHELKGVSFASNSLTRFFTNKVLRTSSRGPEVVFWNYIGVEETSSISDANGWKWFPTEGLPVNTVAVQIEAVQHAGKVFLRRFGH